MIARSLTADKTKTALQFVVAVNVSAVASVLPPMKPLKAHLFWLSKKTEAVKSLISTRSNLNSLEQEVSSTHIGELVMEGLKEVDEVAYVRYASVHRQFKDINTLLNEIEGLVKLKDTLSSCDQKKK